MSESDLTERPAEPQDRSVCPECQSFNVRASQSSYPMDMARIGSSSRSFWRCENCGHRFLGPPTEKRLRSSRRERKADQSLNRSINFHRGARRWLFPVIVILSTILAVVYILERRGAQELQQPTFPES